MEKCPNCGYDNPAKSERCQHCGTDALAIAQTMQEIDLQGATMLDMEVPILEARIPAATLTLKTGQYAGRMYPLRKNQTLGREKCEIILRDPHMSRQHANIKFIDGKFILIDLGSVNYTFVNDELVQTPKTLHDGDVISVGNTDLLFTMLDEE